MKIQQFDCFLARISYHRTDDLQEGVEEDGKEISVQALWKIDEGKFEGDWAFETSTGVHWLPERDLILLKRITHKEYSDDKIKRYLLYNDLYNLENIKL